MSQTISQIICFVVGMGVGWILHVAVMLLRETKEEVDEVLKIERKRDESGILQNRVAFNVVFSLMMVFVFYAAIATFHNSQQLSENQKQDFIRVCVAAEQIRDVQRSTVDEVYNLATSVIRSDDANAPPRSQAEIDGTNAFIDRANEFRAKSYRDIRPTTSCAPYVHDNNVLPPTPPFPHVHR